MYKFLTAAIFISLIVLIASCQKEIDWGTGSSASGNFRAKINDTQWVANKLTAASRFAGFINLTGRSNDNKLLSITLTDSGVHRYTLNDVTFNVAAYLDSNSTNPNAFTTNAASPPTAGGEVNITSIDTAHKKMSGTFSFNAYRQSDSSQVKITNGIFTDLTYSTGLPPAGSTPDTFHVKINGVLFNAVTIIAAVPPAPYNTNLGITGGDSAFLKTVGMNMPSNIIPGTYAFSLLGTYTGVYKIDNNPSNLKVATLGSLTILEHNTTTKRIRGNFNFTASDILNPLNFVLLTEGYFAVTYY
jgi:hypothetical protein